MRSHGAGALLAAMLVLTATDTAAQTVPPVLGSDLLRSCNALIAYATKGGELSVDVTSCAAYLKGLRDGVEAAMQRGDPERGFCAAAAKLDDMARAVVKYVQEHAESAQRPAAGEAVSALRRAYPCARKTAATG